MTSSFESKTIIEQATVEDAEEILDLQKRAYRSEAAIYNDDTLPPLTQTLEEMRNDLNRQVCLKASVDGKVIGSVRAYLKEGSCFIGRLIVDPDLQNRGMGTRLMAEIEGYFKGARRFELFTGHRSERNMYLYKKLGYHLFREETVSKDLKILFLEKIPSSR
jgi:ribosomal protein S18 acetylase RimI-like enzyme